MKIPKRGTKFVYTFDNILFIGVMTSSKKFRDLFALTTEDIVETLEYNFKNCFDDPDDVEYKFISEVNSLEHAQDLYPEYFL